ncbi:MAG TPA: uracil-DNA glycosylase [Candidatus Binatia bacterium]|nr:uracil-DNA glycosylase [Candidatus Binatia bacterium]
MALELAEPGRDCPLCPRLKDFRDANRAALPDYFNAPVPCFGDAAAKLLIVGLAPGLHGANRTGRPFTGDYAGDLLFATLLKLGLAAGTYDERPDDGLTLVGCRIINSVRCVPPQNKPLPGEIATCNRFLKPEIVGSKARAMLALGAIAHQAALTALGEKKSAFKFAHGARHALQSGFVLVDSYHCSRYNTNTGVLTPEMFESAVAQAKAAAGL